MHWHTSRLPSLSIKCGSGREGSWRLLRSNPVANLLFMPLVSGLRNVPLAAVNILGKMGCSHAQRQLKGHRMDIPAEFMSATIDAFEANKRLADRAVEQVPDDKLHVALDENTNSIAVIMKHIAGNLISRWTDFLTTDGEKPWRNRDFEFVDSFSSRAELLEFWERGWACLLETLKTLKLEDLGKAVSIRGEPHSVPLALERSLGHTCYHIGQIVQVARIHAAGHWKTLTIPRGGSERFNKENWGQTGKSHS